MYEKTIEYNTYLNNNKNKNIEIQLMWKVLKQPARILKDIKLSVKGGGQDICPHPH